MVDPDMELRSVQAAMADWSQLNQLFHQYRPRLKRMVQLRINRRLQGRIDESDVVQEALVDASKNIKQYLADPQVPLLHWLRRLTGLKLAEVHRRHLATQKRDVRHELPLDAAFLPAVDSTALANGLIGNISSALQAAIVTERREALQKSLDEMSEIDRELITLKHFEQFTIGEMAQLLNMPRATVGRHYLNAMKKLRDMLNTLPEFNES